LSVAAVPGLTGRSLLGKFAVTLQARAKAKRGTSKAAAFIADHAGTMATLGLVDAGLWQWSQIAGLIGAGVCVAVAELKIRG
jgi:hypothetical protein